jgi:transcriptional regulator with XRE-family HTH domain
MLPETDTFAGRVRYARTLKGFNQTDLAAKVKLTRGAICRWESCNRTPRLCNLAPLANALNCTILWLAEGRGKAPEA